MKYNKFTLGQIEAVFNKLGGEEGVKDFLAGYSKVVKRKFYQFGDDLLNGKGTFTVPINYNHATQLDTFREKTVKLKSTTHYSSQLTSSNFAGATNKLKPGKTYAIKMFPILRTVEGKECLSFLESNNAILVGAQGLSALQNDQPEIFPIEKRVVSFDEKYALWEDACGDHMVPVYQRSYFSWKFSFYDFLNPWRSDNVLVCFCDLD